MLRCLTGCLALMLAATTCVAKPPDLPEKLKITVIAAPDVQAVPDLAAMAERTALDNLDRLIEAGDLLEKAKTLCKDGDSCAARRCLARVRELAPGSYVAKAADEMRGAEEACEETPCCVYDAFIRQLGLCWLSQASRKCEEMCAATRGREVMVDGLMKSAHLALSEGRVCKARELVKQAHALDPARVEGDPLVYKMGLLPTKDELGGEQCEPATVHPKQKPNKSAE